MPHGPVWPFGGAIFSPRPCGFLLVRPVQFDGPKHATVCVSQRHACSRPRHGNLSQGPFTLALLVIIIYPSCQSPRSARCSCMCLANVAERRPTAAPLLAFVPPVTTGDCGCRARCRTSFARCKRAHMWAEVISASATRACWISAGVGAESGPPLGLIVPVFWHAELNSLLHQTPD